MDRMTELKKEKIRCLLKDKDTYIPSHRYCDYRWVPPEQFADVSFYIYGDKVGFIEFLENEVRVTVVNNSAVVTALRTMFDLYWNTSLLKQSEN
ncbi:MAG: hypothetical protein RBR86_03470 [Pseudobdellovibrionaceae bacterium]|nr:hypothetical protein [Pseudobdellovibrionaceae bacterium]